MTKDQDTHELDAVVQIAGSWYARTRLGTVGPLSSPDEVEQFLALLTAVSAARGEIPQTFDTEIIEDYEQDR